MKKYERTQAEFDKLIQDMRQRFDEQMTIDIEDGHAIGSGLDYLLWCFEETTTNTEFKHELVKG